MRKPNSPAGALGFFSYAMTAAFVVLFVLLVIWSTEAGRELIFNLLAQ